MTYARKPPPPVTNNDHISVDFRPSEMADIDEAATTRGESRSVYLKRASDVVQGKAKFTDKQRAKATEMVAKYGLDEQQRAALVDEIESMER